MNNYVLLVWYVSSRLINFVFFCFFAAPPPKNKTGVVKGLKAEEIVKRTGQKIKVTWDNFCHGPKSKELSSMLTHDVGHIIRDEISMVAPTWGDTTDDEQKKLPTKLFVRTFSAVHVFTQCLISCRNMR